MWGTCAMLDQCTAWLHRPEWRRCCNPCGLATAIFSVCLLPNQLLQRWFYMNATTNLGRVFEM